MNWDNLPPKTRKALKRLPGEMSKAIDFSLIGLALALIWAVCAIALCGCLDSASAVTVPSVEAIDFDALLKAADDASWQPKLENEFKKPEGAAPAEVVSKIEVTVYGPPSCAPCAKAIAEGNASTRFEFIKQENIPASIKAVADTWNQGGYPVVTFRDRNGHERHVCPWRGLADFERRYDRTVKPRAIEASPKATFRIPVARGPHWSHPNTISAHLRNDHGVNPTGMSQEQMLSLHDALHEGRATKSTPRRQQYAIAQSGCPGGSCPINRRRK